MRRALSAMGVALGLAASLLVTTTSPAAADTSTTVVWHPGAEPGGARAAGWWSSECDNAALGLNAHTAVNADTTNTRKKLIRLADSFLGTTSWGIAPDAGVRFGPAVRIPDPTALTVLRLSVTQPEAQPINGRALVYYRDPNPAGNGRYWVGEATIDDRTGDGAGTAVWHDLRMGGAGYTWRTYDKYGTPSLGSVEVSSIAAFVQQHRDAAGKVGPAIAGFELGCRMSTSSMVSTDGMIAFDDLVVVTSPPGSTSLTTVTYDLENPAARVAATRTSPATIKPGGKVALRGQLFSRLDGRPLVGRGSLQVKAYGSRSWKAVTSTADATSWNVSTRAQRAAAYRWIYRENGVVAKSGVVKVAVKATISTKASKKKVFVKKPVTISGSIKPAKKAKVVLQRLEGRRWVRLKTTRTTSKGRYSFTLKPATTGTWKLRVKLPAASGNLGNHSSVVKVKVKKKPKPKPPEGGGHHTGGGSTPGGGGTTTPGGGGGTTDPGGDDTCHEVLCRRH